MRYFAEIEYNGAKYHGWQYQPNAISVQETIEKEIKKICDCEGILGCGRTDTGVHASQYYFQFDVQKEIIDNFLFKLNCMLPNDIYVKKVFKVEDHLHARFSATLRAYTYKIIFRKSPFENNRKWIYPYHNLNFELMQQAAIDLKQYKDFEMFCKKGSDVKNFLCQIFSSEIKIIDAENIEYHISANRFLRNMIRRVIGTIVEVGRGRLSLDEFNHTIAEKKTFTHVNLAPPDGLYLSKVEYPF